jgi:hypothetical protein
METVMSALALPLPAAMCALQDTWPHASNEQLAFVPAAQDHLAWGDIEKAERLAYNFIRVAHPAAPELPVERRLSRWRQFWMWLR